MNIGEFLQELYLARKIPQKDSGRRAKTFSFSIKGEKDLPLLVWEYLVKTRAGFKCEDCDSALALQTHHIKPLVGGGKNTLRNGKCVCISCLNKRENMVNLKGRLHESLCYTYGQDKGTKMWEELKKLKTLKEREAMLDSLLKDILPDKNP